MFILKVSIKYYEYRLNRNKSENNNLRFLIEIIIEIYSLIYVVCENEYFL